MACFVNHCRALCSIPPAQQRAILLGSGIVLGVLLRSSAFVSPPGTQLHSGVSPAALGTTAAASIWLGGLPAQAAVELPPAPSGVNTLPELQQAAVVLAIFAGIALLTAGLLGPGFRALRGVLPEGWFENWQKTWPILGLFYLAAGSAHFTAKDAFESIYPPAGTWGFWYLPGSAEFHVAWSGVAEIAGGAGLFFGAVALGIFGALGKEPPAILRALPSAAALGLFVLTWVVTPANVYMYTHGAQMVGLTPGDAAIPVLGHALRGVLQVLLLSILYRYWADTKPSGGVTDNS